MSEERLAIVQKIVKGHNGKYAVAKEKEGEIVFTFSLGDPVWKEDCFPEEGVFVMLSNLCRKSKGWRAMKARLYNLTDEKAMSNKGA